METTEKIVESYIRYIRNWFTIPNIKCEGQKEIDILAVDASRVPIKRYHIEVSVSISGAYSKISLVEYDKEKLKQRVHQAKQRTSIGYFISEKFDCEQVKSKLEEYGFKDNNYERVIVAWGWKEGVKKEAKKNKIELWSFPEMVKELGEKIMHQRSYYKDDTLRTIHLYAKAMSK